MVRIFLKYDNKYLLDIKEETILYTTILKVEILGGNGNPIYSYFETKGVVVHEILWGILFEESYSKDSNIEGYLAFEDLIKNVDIIAEDELQSLLPISVNGDYEDPFNPFGLI